MENGCVAVSGTDMYYVSFGRGKKTLVVLPGLSDGLATVKGKALVLSAPYRKYLGDYSVYMFSRKNSMQKDYTIRQMAEDQALAMKALGIDRAFVLGVSQGGMIAQYLAIDHPEAVEKLILAVTAPYANNTARDAVGTWIEMAERGDHLSLMTDTAERWLTLTIVLASARRSAIRPATTSAAPARRSVTVTGAPCSSGTPSINAFCHFYALDRSSVIVFV